MKKAKLVNNKKLPQLCHLLSMPLFGRLKFVLCSVLVFVNLCVLSKLSFWYKERGKGKGKEKGKGEGKEEGKGGYHLTWNAKNLGLP